MRRRAKQDQDQHILELLEQDLPGRNALGGLQFIGAVFLQARGGLCAAQAVCIALQTGEGCFRR